MRRLATPEADLDFDFVPLFQEPARRPHAHLQVMVVGARPYPYFLDLGHVLVLFRVSSTLVRLKLELAQISNPTDRRLSRGGNLNKVQSGLFGAPNGFFDRHDTNLLALGVENPHFGDAYLAVGPRTSGCRWPRNEWWTRNRRSPS